MTWGHFRVGVVWVTLICTLVGAGIYIENKFDELERQAKKPDGEVGAPVPQIPTEPPVVEPVRRAFSNAGGWGDWSDPLYCPAQHYVCGLRQRVEKRQGKGDDTAMNAVEFYCCAFEAQ